VRVLLFLSFSVPLPLHFVRGSSISSFSVSLFLHSVLLYFFTQLSSASSFCKGSFVSSFSVPLFLHLAFLCFFILSFISLFRALPNAALRPPPTPSAFADPLQREPTSTTTSTGGRSKSLRSWSSSRQRLKSPEGSWGRPKRKKVLKRRILLKSAVKSQR
jgi:hypothetical protein